MKARTLLHLSDIHFKHRTSNGSYDLDLVLRHELEIDATQMSTDLGGTDAILVCGDIAFGAVADEYVIAYKWLQELAETTKAKDKPIQIWTVPGNHDIDWKKIESDRNAQRLRTALRGVTVKKINPELKMALEDLHDRQTLFSPLEEYNRFATNLGCTSGADPLFWEQSLVLNDGSKLVVRGLNSSLLSDHFDSDEQEKTKLTLSGFQTNFLRDDNIIFMTMCHHPLEWIRDRDEVEDWFDAHARLQLFGHRHTHRIRNIEDNLRIASGAVHPDRSEDGWEPRYNFVRLEVRFEQDKRVLHVEIHPRIWSKSDKKFVADGTGVYSRDLSLPARKPSAASGRSLPVELKDTETVAAVVSAIESDLLDVESNQAGAEVRILNAGQRLTSRYLSLPHSLQMEIAAQLGLQQDEDKDLADTELYRRYFKRAKEKQLLERLWSEVENRYAERGEAHFEENPFVGR